MKTWIKIVMWVGMGFGFGFFVGLKKGLNGVDEAYQAGLHEGRTGELQKDIERMNRTVNKAKSEAEEALREYGGDLCGEIREKCNELEEILKQPVTDEEINDEKLMTEVPEMPAAPVGDTDGDEAYHVVPKLHPTQLVPKMVAEAEYYQNPWDFEEEKLVYYEGDEVLYDCTTQSIITYPENVIGIGTLEEFRAGVGLPKDTIYVINEVAGTRFRIDRMEDAFCECVDGTVHPDDDDVDEGEDMGHVDHNDGYWDDV